MMDHVWVPLLITVLLAESSALPSSAGVEPASSCSPGWNLFDHRCFAFYPVWSSWSGANALCSQTQSNLVSPHTPEEIKFLRQLTNTNTPVWLGGYQAQQNGSWLWCDETTLNFTDRTDHMLGESNKDRACMEMEPKSGDLYCAPCGELRFYICSTSCCTAVVPSSKKPADPDIVPGVSLFDIVWSNSDLLAEEILYSSSFIRALASGHLTEQCYTRFLQQEALYLHRVGITLQALSSRLQKADDVRSLLLDTLHHYRSRDQSSVRSPAPEWLHFPLQAFHSVVLEDPIYWVVALSARAALRNFLAGKLLPSEIRPELQPGSGTVTETLYQMWSTDSLEEAAWTQRYRTVIEQHQNQTDVFKAINIFRTHMMAQKSFYKSVICDVEDETGRERTQVII